MRPGNPPLVALDFAQLRARRYWSKPDGGFMTDDAALPAREDQETERLVDEIEAFRKGPEKKRSVPMQ